VKITHKQLKQIIKEELGKLSVTPRMRGQGNRKDWASGPELYEDDIVEDKSGEGKCPDSGCIEQRDGKWRIISNKTGDLWPQTYDSKGNAEDALDAYHASR
jgi:hypothetical protein